MHLHSREDAAVAHSCPSFCRETFTKKKKICPHDLLRLSLSAYPTWPVNQGRPADDVKFALRKEECLLLMEAGWSWTSQQPRQTVLTLSPRTSPLPSPLHAPTTRSPLMLLRNTPHNNMVACAVPPSRRGPSTGTHLASLKSPSYPRHIRLRLS
jgi:hypothetical protein